MRYNLSWDVSQELFWHKLSLTVLIVLTVLENNVCFPRQNICYCCSSLLTSALRKLEEAVGTKSDTVHIPMHF